MPASLNNNALLNVYDSINNIATQENLSSLKEIISLINRDLPAERFKKISLLVNVIFAEGNIQQEIKTYKKNNLGWFNWVIAIACTVIGLGFYLFEAFVATVKILEHALSLPFDIDIISFNHLSLGNLIAGGFCLFMINVLLVFFIAIPVSDIVDHYNFIQLTEKFCSSEKNGFLELISSEKSDNPNNDVTSLKQALKDLNDQYTKKFIKDEYLPKDHEENNNSRFILNNSTQATR
jgi:hypothetical protein